MHPQSHANVACISVYASVGTQSPSNPTHDMDSGKDIDVYGKNTGFFPKVVMRSWWLALFAVEKYKAEMPTVYAVPIILGKVAKCGK